MPSNDATRNDFLQITCVNPYVKTLILLLLKEIKENTPIYFKTNSVLLFYFLKYFKTWGLHKDEMFIRFLVSLAKNYARINRATSMEEVLALLEDIVKKVKKEKEKEKLEKSRDFYYGFGIDYIKD